MDPDYSKVIPLNIHVKVVPPIVWLLLFVELKKRIIQLHELRTARASESALDQALKILKYEELRY